MDIMQQSDEDRYQREKKMDMNWRLIFRDSRKMRVTAELNDGYLDHQRCQRT